MNILLNKTITWDYISAYDKHMTELKLNHLVPITAFEGLSVKVHEDGSFDMLFFQKTDEAGDPVLATVVSAIHIPDEKRWIQIADLVKQQLDQARKQEK